MKLTVSQAAMLAAMVNQPGFFNPDPSAGAGYTALVARWHYVLTNMVRDGALTQQQAGRAEVPEGADGEPAGGQLAPATRATSWQAVESELENTYGYTDQQIDTGGLKIVTTFNERMMNALYQAVDQNLAAMRADGQPLPSYAHVGAVLEKPGTGAILAMYGGPSFSAKNCAKITASATWPRRTGSRSAPRSSRTCWPPPCHEGMDVQDQHAQRDRADVHTARLHPDPPRSLSTADHELPAADWYPGQHRRARTPARSAWPRPRPCRPTRPSRT